MNPNTTETQITRQKYNKNARYYNLMELFVEGVWFQRWRKELLKKIKGTRVLEIGMGTGKNLKYYPKGHWIIDLCITLKQVPVERKNFGLRRTPTSLRKR